MAALHELKEECLRQLEERGADQDAISGWLAAWDAATGPSAKPLPCPVCWLGRLDGRLVPRASPVGSGLATCGTCKTEFYFQE